MEHEAALIEDPEILHTDFLNRGRFYQKGFAVLFIGVQCDLDSWEILEGLSSLELRLAILLKSTKIPTRPNPGNLLHSDLWQNMRSLNGNNRKSAQAGAIKLLYEVFSLN